MYKNARKIKKYSRKSLDNEIDFYLNSISLIVLVKKNFNLYIDHILTNLKSRSENTVI